LSDRTTLASLATFVLEESDALDKARTSRRAAAVWRNDQLALQHGPVKDGPGRPDRPELLPPHAMPKRRVLTTERGRIALLHALAHIEFNAINLAWDIAARFPGMPRHFYDDWISVGDDEARHFLLLRDRLVAPGSDYGALPAHDGLWQPAMATSNDLLARLAIVPWCWKRTVLMSHPT